MNGKRAVAISIALGIVMAASAAWALSEHANAKEAEAMVKKGVAYIKTHGKEKGYAEITNQQGLFHDRDLYLVVYGLDGTVLAHGANEKMVGKQLIALKDIDGKEWVKERVELAKTQGNFWHEYKFTDPLTRKVEPKSTYCERLDDSVVCGGIYKQ